VSAEPRSYATIKDVARRAGVSITTVSFVLNDHPKQSISDKVRERVLLAARRLDYSPRASAVGLAGKRTHNLGIVLYRDAAAVSDPLFSRIIEGAVVEASRQGYNLFLSLQEAPYNRSSDLPKIVRERNVEGLLLMRGISPAMVRAVKARGVAVVAIDPEPAMKTLDTVLSRPREAGRPTPGDLDPPLTAIVADGLEIGRRAVVRLVEMIEGKAAETPSLTRPSLR
jgi:DNA-binding LacI/PurR family transcriptional regulator